MASSTFLFIVVSSFLLASHAFAKQASFSRKALQSPYIETPPTPHSHSPEYILPPPSPESPAFLPPSPSPEFPPKTPLPPSPYPPTPDTPLSPSPSSPYPPTPEFPLPPLAPELAAPPSTDGFTPVVYYPYPPPT